MIAPLVGVICLGVSAVAHKDIPLPLQDNITTAIVMVISITATIWGIFTDHQKEAEQKNLQAAQNKGMTFVKMPNESNFQRANLDSPVGPSPISYEGNSQVQTQPTPQTEVKPQ